MRPFARIVCAALLTASCAGTVQPQGAANSTQARVPFDSPYAPRYSPVPSPRGFAPVAIAMPGGMICNDARLTGTPIAPITSTNPQCGIAAPVSVTTVAGVQLSRPIRINCETAVTLANWTEKTAKPTAQRVLSTALVSMELAAAYSCRTRNSRAGARISEHGKGNAVDIFGFSFSDGKTLSVSGDYYGSGDRRSYMRSVWKDACGTFGTVLGPDADRYHKNHFHFDIAKHQNGAYCQ